MDSKMLSTMGSLVEECPKCLKVSLDNGGIFEVTQKHIIRKCSCGYSLKITIDENFQEENETKILKG